jgi:hypothetical protein
MQMYKKPSVIAILIIGLITVLISSNLNWPTKFSNGIIESDAKGYYAWLPAIFIYHDLSFSFKEEVEENYPHGSIPFEYRISSNEKISNKYYAGVAFLVAPFFIIAHFITILFTNLPADGYSYWYPVMVNIAAIFYLIAGLIFIRKLLLQFNFKEAIIAWVLIALFFATNLFYYSIVEPGMSHVYSFFCFSAFLYYFNKWAVSGNSKNLILVSLFFGIIILIRPINGLIIFISPFFFNGFNEFSRKVALLFKRKNVQLIIVTLVLLFAIISIQPILYFIQTGSFFLYSYGNETFQFRAFHLFDFLFSYKKGAFLYHPILLISMLGFLFLWKENRFKAIYLLVFLTAIFYIFSCWWSWWYGGSFGQRVLVEFLPLFALLLAYLIRIRRDLWVKIAIVLCILLCQIQTYQYRYFLIHWEDMNREKYWEVFLKLK